MRGKLITTGIDGIFMNSRAYSDAHKEWFNFYAKLLKMPELKKYANLPQDQYWPGVKKAMVALYGKEFENDDELHTYTARHTYQQLVLMCAAKLHRQKTLVKAVHRECIDLYRLLKMQGNDLWLVTTSPETIVSRLLELAGCSNLFSRVEACPITEKPSSDYVISRMTGQLRERKSRLPAVHIGAGLSAVKACNRQKIPAVLTMWETNAANYKELEQAEILAPAIAKNPAELRSALEVLLKI
jgi:phosphoglycolate phosphatase-like HAD superfamily hydrolase